MDKLKLNIQMFANLISTHSTYWQVSNSSSPYSEGDARPYFNFYYDTNSTTGVTTYTMDVYAQCNNPDSATTRSYNITCTIGGQTFNRTGSYTLPNGSWTLTKLFTVTKQVNCNSDGTGVQIAYSIYGQADTYYSTRYGSTYYFTPPTVNLNAKLGTINSFTIGTDFTVPATIYNSSYTHTLTIKIGSTTIGTRTITSASTTITFSSSELTTIYNAMTTTNSTTFTFELVTMNGSTQIGSTSTTTATGTLTNVTPVISNTGSSVSTSALSNQNVISGYSNVTVTFKATPQKNATITSAKVNGASATAGSSNDYSITINKATTGTFKIEVTDSRGNIATSTITKTLINYITLTLSAEIKRTSSTDSNITMTFSGNYWTGNFGMASNVLKTFWNYREKGTTDWTFGGDLTPTISGTTYSGSADLGSIYDYTKDYEFQVIANDQLNYITTQYQVSKGLGILELYQTTALVNGDLVSTGKADFKGGVYSNGTELQTKLVSGTNIQTINSASILASGNLELMTKHLVDSKSISSGETYQCRIYDNYLGVGKPIFMVFTSTGTNNEQFILDAIYRTNQYFVKYSTLVDFAYNKDLYVTYSNSASGFYVNIANNGTKTLKWTVSIISLR